MDQLIQIIFGIVKYNTKTDNIVIMSEEQDSEVILKLSKDHPEKLSGASNFNSDLLSSISYYDSNSNEYLSAKYLSSNDEKYVEIPTSATLIKINFNNYTKTLYSLFEGDTSKSSYLNNEIVSIEKFHIGEISPDRT